MSYKEKAQDIYHQLQQGKLLDAFDKYYAEHVVMTEPRGTREGKAEFHSLEINKVGSNEDEATSFVESTMDVTFKDGNRVTMEQVAVQQWENDHIVHERFYYNNA